MNSVTQTLFEQFNLELWRVTLFREYIFLTVADRTRDGGTLQLCSYEPGCFEGVR